MRTQTKGHIRKRVEARIRNGTYKHSETTKRKISLLKIGKKQTPESNAKRSQSLKLYYQQNPEALKLLRERVKASHTGGSLGHHWKQNPETIAKRIGVKNPAWKGGITPLNTALRNSKKFQEWRRKLFERDGYRCFDCGAKSGETGKTLVLHADHIYPFATYPRLRFEVDNGRTLCVGCHRKTPTYGGRVKSFVVA